MSSILLESILPGLYGYTIASNQAIDFSGAPSVALPGATTVGGAQTITSASANAFSVGRQGTTNPAFNVDASAATSVTGLSVVSKAVAGGINLQVITSGTNEGLRIISAGNGFVTIQPGTDSTGFFVLRKADGSTNYFRTDTTNSRVEIGVFGSNAPSATLDVWTTQANGFSVGANGVTNPVFLVDASTATVATGIKIKGAAAAAGVAVTVISSGTDENLTLDAKGAGTITINGTATGGITLGQSVTITEAKNIILGTTTGTQIGTGTTQKLSFYGATAVVQQTDGAALTNSVTSGGTTNTIANYTDLTVYANDSAAIRNDIYQLARKLKIVGDALRTYGLLS